MNVWTQSSQGPSMHVFHFMYVLKQYVIPTILASGTNLSSICANMDDTCK